MSDDNRPWSEIFREAADDWADKESAAQLLEDTKSAVMAQRQIGMGNLPVNKAEQLVKASPEWMEYLERIVNARTAANRAKVKLEFLRMKFNEWQSAEANARTEARL